MKVFKMCVTISTLSKSRKDNNCCNPSDLIILSAPAFSRLRMEKFLAARIFFSLESHRFPVLETFH